MIENQIILHEQQTKKTSDLTAVFLLINTERLKPRHHFNCKMASNTGIPYGICHATNTAMSPVLTVNLKMFATFYYCSVSHGMVWQKLKVIIVNLFEYKTVVTF